MTNEAYSQPDESNNYIIKIGVTHLRTSIYCTLKESDKHSNGGIMSWQLIRECVSFPSYLILTCGVLPDMIRYDKMTDSELAFVAFSLRLRSTDCTCSSCSAAIRLSPFNI